MVKEDVIEPVDTPTDWCSPIVVVPKPNGNVRLCVDLTKLNKSVKREVYAMPSVEETLSKISQGCVFSKLDANSGFHQIPLDDASSELTTFITPFGRFKFKRLPYGITSAPEYFQKRMDSLLHGLPGVLCHMDDILVFGKDKAEHDVRLNAVLERLSKAHLTLNPEKFEFAKTQLEYLGQIVDSSGGLKKDPAKVKAILEMEAPKNVAEIRRFLGMVNQLMKFLPNLADKTKPLRDLLRKDTAWTWGPDQQGAFDTLKKDLSSPETLALYSPDRETIISADSSSYGLGAVFLQRQNNGLLHPVAYASRSLTTTEQRYAQIEKEALAVTWSLEHWYNLLVGMKFHVQTDHKPLVPLFSTKTIDELPIRIQRFRMRLMRFSFDISHVPGKELCTADALSRAPLPTPETFDDDLTQQSQSYVSAVLLTLPASDRRLEEIRAELQKDDILKTVMHHVQNGWPDKKSMNRAIKAYYNEQGFLSIHDGLLMRGNRLVIPSTLRHDVLRHLHDGHQGVNKTRENAANSVWWPGVSADIEKMVKTCPDCAKNRRARIEPMRGTPFPSRAWSRIATDFFQQDGKHFLLVIDYFSRDVEIFRMKKTNTSTLIKKLKKVFARHGIPDILVSDNGPQYTADDFRKFAQAWNFEHITSSPHYPQSNGEAERAVQTLKNLILKCEDEDLGLLMYRNTPLHNGFSPAQLSMGRRLKTRVPCPPDSLLPQTPNLAIVKKREKEYRENMKKNYDQKHRVVAPEDMSTGDTVWIPDQKKQGVIIQHHDAPRSLIIKTDDGGLIRRNQSMTRKLPCTPYQQGNVPPSFHSFNPNPADPIQSRTLPSPSAQPHPSAHSPPGIPVTSWARQDAPAREVVPPTSPAPASGPTPTLKTTPAQSQPSAAVPGQQPRKSNRPVNKPKRLIEHC